MAILRKYKKKHFKKGYILVKDNFLKRIRKK